MEYIIDKEVTKQVQLLMSRGGKYQKAAEAAKKIFGAIAIKQNDPFNGIPLTNHGEGRIKHCIKYDLSGFCRLITIQNKDKCIIKFLGDHEKCDGWLNIHRGLNIGLDTESNILTDVIISEDIIRKRKEEQINQIIHLENFTIS